MSERSVYQRAVDVFGEESQIGQLHEEMGELMQAINKRKRHGGKLAATHWRECVIEETVDLMIMCEQMKCIFDMNGHFDNMMQYKLTRLEETIDTTEAEQ